MYRKNEGLDCKNRANGRGWVGGFGGGAFKHLLKMLNENAQVLDFQRFGSLSKSLSILCAKQTNQARIRWCGYRYK
jgi:hypothetical protein